MTWHRTALLLGSPLFLACQSHLFFAESAHVGLKAKFALEGPSPFEVDIGYRRGLVATIPKRAGDDAAQPRVQGAAAPAGAGAPQTVDMTITDDPEDLMALYTTFRANVGMNDPIDICHFLATGRAANYLLSDLDAVKGVSHETCAETPQAGGQSQ